MSLNSNPPQLQPLELATVDQATLAYAVVATAALAFHWPVRIAYGALLPLAHLGVVAVALLAPRARRLGTVGAFLGDLYPIFIVSLLYTEVGFFNATAGRAHDHVVQAAEQWLFGFQPSVEWIRAWPWPWLSAVLHSSYLAYYAIVALPPLLLWFGRQREQARQLVKLVALTFYISYTVFLLFPVAGPRYAFPLAENAATAIPLATFTQRLLNSGAAWGTAFPSSHVAVALVASIRSAWASRVLGWIFVPLAVLLSLATVYGQFHYAIDALGGLLLAAAVLGTERLRLGRRRALLAASVPA